MHQSSNGSLPSPSNEMTMSQAADFLDVPQSLLLKLIRRKELPSRTIDKRRYIPTSALMEYREKMYQRAKEAADEMAHSSQEAGLYERENTLRQGQ
jgi:excisionase family DNA binding protein